MKSLCALGIAFLCAACATPERFAKQVLGRSQSAVHEIEQERVADSTIRSEETNFVRGIAVEYVPSARGVVTLRAAEIPLSAAMSALAEVAGVTMNYQAGVDAQRSVSLNLRELDPATAIREAAHAAGLVAVFERPKLVVVAREATFTFRVPARVLKTLQSRYSVSNAATSSATIAPTPSPASPPSTSTSGTASALSVNGSSSRDSSVLRAFLAGISGTEPVVLAEEGIISARGTSTQLRRLQAFLDQYVRESLSQVEIELSVLEVSLTSEFSSGIDWRRVVSPGTLLGNSTATVALQAGSDFGDGAFSVRTTTRSIDSVVRALEQFTRVHELTRPKVLAMNHAQTLYRASVQKPYLPTASSNVTTGGAATTVQSSAAVSYSEDGVTFGVQAHILDAHRVEVTLIPVITSTQRIDSFQISRDVSLSAPVQPRQDAHLQILAEHGKTMVVAGLKASAAADRVSGIPGAVRVPGLDLLLGAHADSTNAREVVILLNTRILPAPRISTVIGESP